MMTDIQKQWLTEYLGCIIRESRHYWGLYKWCPKEIMFQSGILNWIDFLLDQEIPGRAQHKVTVENVNDDIIAMRVNGHIFADYSEVDHNDPDTGKIIMPNGTVVFNIRIPFPDIPDSETKESLDNLLNNGEVIKWMEHDLNVCTHNNYELKLSYLSTETALVESWLYSKFGESN